MLALHKGTLAPFVMDTLVALVMTKALQKQHLSLTIRPHSYRLGHTANAMTRRGRCSGCCSF